MRICFLHLFYDLFNGIITILKDVDVKFCTLGHV